MANITDTIYLTHDTVMESKAEKRLQESNIVLEGTEKLPKRENQGWKQEDHARDVRTP